jgi:hypothetical protein
MSYDCLGKHKVLEYISPNATIPEVFQVVGKRRRKSCTYMAATIMQFLGAKICDIRAAIGAKLDIAI